MAYMKYMAHIFHFQNSICSMYSLYSEYLMFTTLNNPYIPKKLHSQSRFVSFVPNLYAQYQISNLTILLHNYSRSEEEACQIHN